MPSELNSAALQRADRAHVLGALAGFSGNPVTHWLAPNHPAKRGSLPSTWRQVSGLSPANLIEAVAAVTPNHCVDGWGYASRSMAAMLAGDFHASRHLAYYAQLRAALGLLGNLGVGIFNGVNFVVDGSATIIRLDHDLTVARQPPRGLGTHAIVWEALHRWVSMPGAAGRLLGLIRFSGTSLFECLQAIFPGLAPSGIAGSLIQSWGVDLQRGRQEHLFRNISSYAPHAMNDVGDTTAEAVDFIEQAWRLFEPTSASCFDLLDRHILRNTLSQQVVLAGVAGGVSHGPILTRYQHLPETVKAIATVSFLTRGNQPDDPLLITAARRRRNPATAVDMLARALLLLRVCTAVTISSFTDAGVSCSGGELRPWLDKLAVLRGFWAPTSPLDDPRDLWVDVELALDELVASKTPPPASLNDWITHTVKGLPTITEAERIGVWSFGG